MSRGGATAADWPALVAAALSAQAAGHVASPASGPTWPAPTFPATRRSPASSPPSGEAVAVAEPAGARPEVRHLANTAATLTLPETWFDLVRPGGAVYGLATLPGGAPPSGCAPALTVRARLVLAKQVPAGTAVSYGHRYITQGPSTLGLCPAGLRGGHPADRLRRGRGTRPGPPRRIAGTVCMDLFVLDFAGEPAEAGDEVVLFGPGDSGEPTAQEWADALGTISYEVVTNFTGLLPRTYPEVAFEEGPAPAGTSSAPAGSAAP